MPLGLGSRGVEVGNKQKINTLEILWDKEVEWCQAWGKVIGGREKVISILHRTSWGFPGSSDGKEFTCNAGDPGRVVVPNWSELGRTLLQIFQIFEKQRKSLLL